MVQTSDTADKDFKAAMIKMFKEPKEDVLKELK